MGTQTGNLGTQPSRYCPTSHSQQTQPLPTSFNRDGAGTKTPPSFVPDAHGVPPHAAPQQSCGSALWAPASQRTPCPGTHHPHSWARWLPPRLGRHSPGEQLSFGKSPHTSEGFFSFCRDQVDLVFGILEHLEADVV